MSWALLSDVELDMRRSRRIGSITHLHTFARPAVLCASVRSLPRTRLAVITDDIQATGRQALPLAMHPLLSGKRTKTCRRRTRVAESHVKKRYGLRPAVRCALAERSCETSPAP